MEINNGFIINYFNNTCGNTVNYPISFTTTCKPVACIYNSNPGRGESVIIQSFSKTNILFFGSYFDSPGNIPYTVRCIVIGY